MPSAPAPPYERIVVVFDFVSVTAPPAPPACASEAPPEELIVFTLILINFIFPPAPPLSLLLCGVPAPPYAFIVVIFDFEPALVALIFTLPAFPPPFVVIEYVQKAKVQISFHQYEQT